MHSCVCGAMRNLSSRQENVNKMKTLHYIYVTLSHSNLEAEEDLLPR